MRADGAGFQPTVLADGSFVAGSTLALSVRYTHAAILTSQLALRRRPAIAYR